MFDLPPIAAAGIRLLAPLGKPHILVQRMSPPSGFYLTTIDAASAAASAAVLPATAAVARKSGANQGVARSTSGLRQGHLQDSHLNNHLLLFAHQRKPNGNRHNNDDDEGGRRNDLPVRACEASFVLERVYLLGEG